MRGFTLIETLLYIALAGFLMTGTMLTVFGLLESASKNSSAAVVQNEGAFVIRKIEWEFMKDTAVQYRINAGALELSYDGVTYVPLTTANVVVSAVNVVSTSGVPRTLSASTTLNGVTFSASRTIR